MGAREAWLVMSRYDRWMIRTPPAIKVTAVVGSRGKFIRAPI
jgi:hypothetical protein